MTALWTSLDLTLRGRVLCLLIALSVGAAWLTGDPHARLAASLLVAPMFVDLLFKTRQLDRVAVRIAPRRTEAGAPFLETLELTNQATHRSFQDLGVSEPQTATWSSAGLVESLAPGHRAVLQLPARSRRRSHLLERVVELESGYPLGFVRARTAVRVTADMVTEPARVRLPVSILEAVQRGEPEHRDNTLLGGTDFHSLREYSHGEDARGVHALRSASLGVLVRRTTRGQMPREVGMVLDLRRPPGRPPGRGLKRFEWSLSACASLVEALRGQQLTVHCVILGGDPRQELIASEQGTRDFFTFLAEASASAHRPVDETLLHGLEGCEGCYWVPAGGYLSHDETQLVSGSVTVIGTEVA